MYGVSVKVWREGVEGEEFSIVLTHNTSVQAFLTSISFLLQSSLGLDPATTSLLSKVGRSDNEVALN